MLKAALFMQVIPVCMIIPQIMSMITVRFREKGKGSLSTVYRKKYISKNNNIHT